MRGRRVKINSMLIFPFLCIICLSCRDNYTPILSLDKEIQRRSEGKYELVVGPSRDNIYESKDKYFILPNLKFGMYLLYPGNDSKYPSMSYDIDQGYNTNYDLHVNNIREIYFTEHSFYVTTNESNYVVTKPQDSLLPELEKIDNIPKRSYKFGYIFHPISWSYENPYISVHSYLEILDLALARKIHKRKEYPKETKVMICRVYGILKIGLCGNIVLGKTVTSHFYLDMESDVFKYICQNEYLDLLYDCDEGHVWIIEDDYKYQDVNKRNVEEIKVYEKIRFED